jgi:SAM-dependent MidA family methyltransferase
LNLEERLRERVRLEGPISFYEWMKAALYDEREGYYCRRDIVRRGRLGDYRTVPERTPLFAATFARYFANLFKELGSPQTWTLIEVGAGYGEFAADVLRNLQLYHPKVFGATHYVVDEFSDEGRERAAVNLAGFETSFEFCSLSQIDRTFPIGLIFSNELIDAFPVHRIINRDAKLRSLYVGLNEHEDFVWRESEVDPLIADYCRRAQIELHENQIAEINPEADRFIERAARLLERGFVITVDYGDEREALLTDPYRRQGTLRAAWHHQISSDILQQPGRRDLTTTIDWTQIRHAGDRAGLRVLRHERLDQFLISEGLLDVLAELTEAANQAETVNLRAGSRELILPTGMAASFQVMVQEKPPV